MNKYLIFRTDRIGDFLLTIILIKSIKRNDPNSYIKVVASEKNFDYIKSFSIVDEVILFKKSIINRFKLINLLKIDKYNAIIIHDSKKRSIFISFFLKANLKLLPNANSNISYFVNIKNILKRLDFNFDPADLNTLSNRKYNSLDILDNEYIHFHFDKKWIHKEYIQNYFNIEPTINELISFFNSILNKTKKNLVVTKGLNSTKILDEIFTSKFNPRIFFLKNLIFFEIENIIDNCDLLISCHGAISHVAAAKNMKQIDIIEESKSKFYKKWTDHFRNYNYIYRKNFNELAKDILKLL
jgi:ADP-heptose:LPS heptosyltransferase